MVAIGFYALQSALLGLVWGYEITFSLPVLAAFAVMIPPVTYAALTSMVSTVTTARLARTLVPAVAVAIFVLCIPLLDMRALDDLLDVIIVLVYSIYGGLMIWIGLREETEWMDQLPFQRLMSAGRTFLIAGVAMLASAAVDVAVTYSLATGAGRIAPEIVSISNAILLLALGWSVLRMSSAAPTSDAAATTEADGLPLADALPLEDPMIDGMTREELRAQQTATMAVLDEFMLTHRIYRDENLSLNRLARKTLIPSRQISIAINNLRALNVPQYVNTFRIIEACERLKKTDAPVTEIIYDVGFTTKSNFNREFLRVVGLSPSAWRRSADFGNQPSNWPFVLDFIPSMPSFSGQFSLHSAEEST